MQFVVLRIIDKLLLIVSIIVAMFQLSGYSLSVVIYPETLISIRENYSYLMLLGFYLVAYFVLIYIPASYLHKYLEKKVKLKHVESNTGWLRHIALGIIIYICNIQLIEIFLYGPHPDYLNYYTPEAWGFAVIYIITSLIYIVSNKPKCRFVTMSCGHSKYISSMLTTGLISISIYTFYPYGQ